MTNSLPKGFVLSYDGKSSKIDARVFVAPTACVIGDVEVEQDASIGFGSHVRGDEATIQVGPRTNIQDGVIIHSDSGKHVVIGNDTTVGHGAIIHSCKIGDGVLIGMGAIVLDSVVIESGAFVGAGAVIGPGKCVPANTLRGLRSVWPFAIE